MAEGTPSGGQLRPHALVLGLLASLVLAFGGPTADAAWPDDAVGCTRHVTGTEDLEASLPTYATISAAVTAATGPTEVVCIDPGTFSDNVVIPRSMTIRGAGRDSTTITSAAAALPTPVAKPVVEIQASDVTVAGLRVTGAVGAMNNGAGVYVTGAAAVDHLMLEDVASVDNEGVGVAFNNTFGLSAVTLSRVVASDNDDAGIRIASAIPTFRGLTVEDCVIERNGTQGISYNPSGWKRVNNDALLPIIVGTGFSLVRTTLADNGRLQASPGNVHDISFAGFTGSATLQDVTVSTSNRSGHAIVFYGWTSTPYAPAGAITLEHVQVRGTVAKSALYFLRYANLQAVSMTDVDLSETTTGAAWPQMVVDNAVGPFDIGNLRLKTLKVSSAVQVDARAAEFRAADGGALSSDSVADGFQIERQVVHAVDSPLVPGLVRWKEHALFVTATTATNTSSIPNAVAAAAAGDTINVDAGTYVGGALTQRVSLAGAGSGAGGTTLAAGPTAPEAVVSVTADGGSPDLPMTIRGVRIVREEGGLAGGGAGIAMGPGFDGYLTIDDVVVTGQHGPGVLVGHDVPLTGVAITGSSLVGNGADGIDVRPCAACGAAGELAISNSAVRENAGASVRIDRPARATIRGSDVGGAIRGVSEVDARVNWWGSASGPSAAAVDDTVLTSPWIASFTPDPAKAAGAGFWPTAIDLRQPTPTGANVATPVVSPTGDPVGTIIFANVTAPGETTVAAFTSEFPVEPAGFRLGDPPTYYEIDTTAAFAGPVEICLVYPDGSFPAGTTPQLLHYAQNTWQNVTTRVDEATRTVCGAVTSLSPFAIGSIPASAAVTAVAETTAQAPATTRTRATIVIRSAVALGLHGVRLAVRVNRAGTVVVTGTRTDTRGSVRACAARRSVPRAGTYTLYCDLAPIIRRAAARADVHIALRATFRATGSTPVSATRTVTVHHTPQRTEPVAG